MISRLLHFLVRWFTRASYRSFIKNIHEKDFQKNLLLGILDKNKDTEFGRAHGFGSIKNESDFRTRVPIRSWEELETWTGRIKTPQDRILSSEPTLLFEPTSGSSGKVKLIPYTDSFRKSYSRGVNVWLHDLYLNYPGIARGKHFWSLSPVAGHIAPDGCEIPVGFEEDSQYLGISGRFLRRLFVLPPDLKKRKDLTEFLRDAAVYLVLAKDLTLISVWNPSFLSLILDALFSPGSQILEQVGQRDSRRVPVVAKALTLGLCSQSTRLLWPQLALVSAWGSGESLPGFEKLRQVFPHADFQEKGLLATEALITFPFVPAQGFIPAYQSHYYEFFPVDALSPVPSPLGLRELKPGGMYKVILTTDCLYRYDLGDCVRVRGFYEKLPLLEFAGRLGVCDQVGEKLNGLLITQILEQIKQTYEEITWVFMAPDQGTSPPCYRLFIQVSESIGDFQDTINTVVLEVEKSLMGVFHYRYARDLGQLGPVAGYNLKASSRDLWLHRQLKEGMKLGDIKDQALDKRPGWVAYFQKEEHAVNNEN